MGIEGLLQLNGVFAARHWQRLGHALAHAQKESADFGLGQAGGQFKSQGPIEVQPLGGGCLFAELKERSGEIHEPCFWRLRPHVWRRAGERSTHIVSNVS